MTTVVKGKDEEKESSLIKEIESLSKVNSRMVIPLPAKRTVVEDMVNGFMTFRNSVRWRAFFNKKDEPMSGYLNDKSDGNTFNTGLRSRSMKGAPIADPNVEKFLKDVYNELIQQISNTTIKANKKTIQLRNIRSKLGKTSLVVVPTDKTNRYSVIRCDEYIKYMMKHINKEATPVELKVIKSQINKAEECIGLFRNDISKGEYKYVYEIIQTRKIPRPMLFIKDHKKKNEDGEYATRPSPINGERVQSLSITEVLEKRS